TRSAGARTMQASLFTEKPACNVIPIKGYAQEPVGLIPRSARDVHVPPGRRPAKESASKRGARSSETQTSLPFLPTAPPKPRTLSTTVDAVIFCEEPVAATAHRAVAGALDWAMVSIGYGLFLVLFRFSCG